MNYAEFAQWTESLVEERQLTREQAEDVREQRRLFDEERATIELEFAGRIVGFVARERLVSDRVVTLLDEAVSAYEGRQVYFEPIGERAMELLVGGEPA